MKMSVIKYFRWILGGVLIIAGILKIYSPDNLIEVILFFDLLSENNATVFAYLASAIEIVLGVNLIARYKPRVTATLVGALCTIFLMISIVGYLNNWELVCGCLGEFTYGNFDGVMVLRNTFLFGMATTIIGTVYKSKETPIGVK